LRSISGRKRLLRSLSPRRAKPNGSANVRMSGINRCISPAIRVAQFREVIFQLRPESRRFCQAPSGPRTLVGSICPNSVVPTRNSHQKRRSKCRHQLDEVSSAELELTTRSNPQNPGSSARMPRSRTRASAGAATSRGISRKTRPTQVCHSPSQSLFLKNRRHDLLGHQMDGQRRRHRLDVAVAPLTMPNPCRKASSEIARKRQLRAESSRRPVRPIR
jgi:hypothetical protein